MDADKIKQELIAERHRLDRKLQELATQRLRTIQCLKALDILIEADTASLLPIPDYEI